MASRGASRGHQRPLMSGHDGRRSLLLEVLSEAEVIDLGLDGTVDDLPPMTTRLLLSNLHILQAVCWLIFAGRLGIIFWGVYQILNRNLLSAYYSITISAISFGFIEYFAYYVIVKANHIVIRHPLHNDTPTEYSVDYDVSSPVQQSTPDVNIESIEYADFRLVPWVNAMCILLSIVTHMCVMLEMLFLCYAYHLPSPMFLCSCFTIFLSNGPIMMIFQFVTLPCMHPIALSDRSTFSGCIPLLSPLSVIRVALYTLRRTICIVSSFFKNCLLYFACQAYLEQWRSSCRRICSRLWHESRFFQGVSNNTILHNNRRSRLFQPSQDLNSQELMKEYEIGLNENSDHISRTLSYDNTKASASMVVDGDEYGSSSSDNVVECVMTPMSHTRHSLQFTDVYYASCSETLQVANSCLLLDMSAACLFVKTHFLPLVEVETHEFLTTIISLLRLFSGDICLLLYLFFGIILEPHPLFYVLLATTALKLLLQVSTSLVANIDSIVALWCLDTD